MTATVVAVTSGVVSLSFFVTGPGANFQKRSRRPCLAGAVILKKLGMAQPGASPALPKSLLDGLLVRMQANLALPASACCTEYGDTE